MSKPVIAKRGTVVAPDALLYIRAAALHKFMRPVQIERDVSVDDVQPPADEGAAPITRKKVVRVVDNVNRPTSRWCVTFALVGHPDERGAFGTPLASGAIEVDHVEGLDPLKEAYARLKDLKLSDGWTFEA